MWSTSGDILNMSLAIGFIVLVIFLCFFLFYGILILRDISKVAEDVEELVERVHKTVLEPLRAVDYVIEKAKPFLEAFVESKVSSATKKQSKKS